jgi:uncharacterized HAD superfamily protein
MCINKVFAVDFDGTLCEENYPNIGTPFLDRIRYLIRLKKEGNKLILWTCRCGKYLEEAVEWCKKHGLEFDAINENLPERIEQYGGDCRKLSADYYIDDKSISLSMFDSVAKLSARR